MENEILKRCPGTKVRNSSSRLTEPHEVSIHNFSKSKNSKDGLDYVCKDCKKTKNLEFRQQSEHYSKTYYHSVWKIKNPSYNQMYYQSHKEQHTRSVNRWAKNNPNSARQRQQARRSRKRKAFVEEVQPERLLELYGNHCFLGCGRVVTTLPETWHIEHVIPLSRGGEHSLKNCRVACADCNLSKHSKTYYEVVLSWNGHWKNFSISNLHLFNENAVWHQKEIIKQALAARSV